MHQSILSFRGRRYLWISLLFVGATIAAYALHDPQEPPNGGTLLGYTLGGIATAMIIWLTWFGIRKRRYASSLGSVQGWLSAHVYLGLVLPIVALLHAGFQFGLNVHTLAFILLLLVVASGVYGVFLYLTTPDRISANRGGASRPELFNQLEDLDERSRRATRDLPTVFADLAQSSAVRTQLGDTLWSRLRGKDLSTIVVPETGEVVPNAGQEAALDWLADQQSRVSDSESAARIGELSALLRNKRRLLKQLRQDLKLQASLELWLYAHVPLTSAMLVAVLIHIVTVFLYW